MTISLKFNKSLASHHFPRMTFRKGKRLLWNPLSKKALKIRPEERVRLQYIDYLVLQKLFRSSRISTETPVPSRYSSGRTDILCYDSDFNPLLLIECKAEKVKPGPKAATQSATYNRFIKAPYILLTNGVQDALFHVESSLRPLHLKEYPSFFRSDTSCFNSTPEYWKERGFLHQNMTTEKLSTHALRLAQLFHSGTHPKSYIRIVFPTDNMALSHYYTLLTAPAHPDTLIAVGFKALDPSSSILSVIYNQKGSNTACLRIYVNDQGVFYSAELYLAQKQNLTEPDISDMVNIWNQIPDALKPYALKADAHAPDITDMSLQSQLFLNQLCKYLERILFKYQPSV